MRKPVGVLNYVTFPYGDTRRPYSASNPHAGVDYSYSPDPYAYAPEKITITSIGYLGDCGLAIDAKGQNGRTYRYCHLANDLVSKGQTVAEGAKVGTIGASGNAIGKHLHFVMWVKGTRVNPDTTIKALMKGEDMLTTKEYYELKRFYHGTTPTSDDQKKYVGKITAAQLTTKLKTSSVYKTRIAQAKAGTLKTKNHLPEELRNNLK